MTAEERYLDAAREANRRYLDDVREGVVAFPRSAHYVIADSEIELDDDEATWVAYYAEAVARAAEQAAREAVRRMCAEACEWAQGVRNSRSMECARAIRALDLSATGGE